MSIDRVGSGSGSGSDQLPRTETAPQARESATFAGLVGSQAADIAQGATHTPRNGLRPSRSLDGAFRRKANQPTAAEHQETDRLAEQLIDWIEKQGLLSPHATFDAILDAVKKAKEAFSRAGSSAELTAASYLALAQLDARTEAMPEDRKVKYLVDIGRSFALAHDERLTFDEQVKIARLIVESAAVRASAASRSGLATLLKEVATSTFERNSKTVFEALILNSKLARSVPGQQGFLRRYAEDHERLSDFRFRFQRSLKTVARAAFEDAIVEHGASQAFLTDAALRNAIGRALKLEHERLPQTEGDRKLAEEGRWELFSGEQLEKVSRIAKAIREAGGPDAKVTFLPVVWQFVANMTPTQIEIIFGVANARGTTTFVDGNGRTSHAVEDFLPTFGTALFPKGEKLTVGPDGKVPFTIYDPSAPRPHPQRRLYKPAPPVQTT